MLNKKQGLREFKLISLKEAALCSFEKLIDKFNSHIEGLSNGQAEKNLEIYGINKISKDNKTGALLYLLKAFVNPFIIILFILGTVSFLIDYYIPLRKGEDTDISKVIIISIMVLTSGLLRFWQEFRMQRASEKLQDMISTYVTVLRRDENGNSINREIRIEELVPGDILVLSAGDMIPADIRIINSKDLFISQAILTGESLPVEKHAHPLKEEQISKINITEINNICLMGTNVSSGNAKAIVISTGDNTYFASLAKSITGRQVRTAFDKGVASVSWMLMRFTLIMVPIVFIINGITSHDWSQALLYALAAAVGLTPEMLPMVVSANLARGAVSMSKHKVVVKAMHALQNFGAMDVLCTDKTGTLTQDRIILEHYVNLEDEPDNVVLMYAFLNAYNQTGVKNLIDKAIVRFSQERDLSSSWQKDYEKVDELPFDFARRRVSIIVKKGHTLTLTCKGAVEEMLDICTKVRKGNNIYDLNDDIKFAIIGQANKYNNEGFRVLILATKELPSNWNPPITTNDEHGLVIQGLLTFLDPPKESALQAIKALKEKGVEVKVLTGDNDLITAKVCKSVDLEPGKALQGHEIENMHSQDLAIAVEKHTIFTKMTPLQKVKVLKQLQENGHVVGFLGDGINDAPSLRESDIGISVDSATDIAKESADMILLEKNLMVLHQGLVIGRQAFGNVIKYLNITASSNYGNVFSVLIASIILPFLPMLPLQLLVQNVIYDMSQLALPWDSLDQKFLEKPRQWNADNISRFTLWVGPTSSIFDVLTFAVMWYVFGANSLETQDIFHSGWFIEGLLSQTLVVHMLRTERVPFLQSRPSMPILITSLIVAVIGVMLPYTSWGLKIGLVPLPYNYFYWLTAILLGYFVLAQGIKKFYIRKFGSWF